MTDMKALERAEAPGFGAFIGSDEADQSKERSSAHETEGEATVERPEGEAGGPPSRPRRRRGSRGGRRRSGSTTPNGTAPEEAGERTAKVEATAAEGDAATSSRRRRRKRSSRRTSPDGSSPLAVEEEGLPPTEGGDSRPASDDRSAGARPEPEGGDAPEGGEPVAVDPGAEAAEARTGGRGRRKRSVRRRMEPTPGDTTRGEVPGAEETLEEETLATGGDDEPAPAGGDSSAKKTRRRRGTRGGRKRRKKGAAGDRVDAAVFEVIPGEDDDLPSLPEDPEGLESDEADEGPTERGTAGRKKKRKRSKKMSSASEVEETGGRTSRTKRSGVVPDQMILVNACDREEVRVAVIRDGTILDFQMNVERDKTLVGDIYRGRVVNIEASIGAAFIDFGRGRNGFLHTSDVLPSYGSPGWSLSKLVEAAVDPDEVDGESSALMADELDFDESAEGDKQDDDSGDRGKGPKRGDGARKVKAPRRRFRPRRPIKEMLKVGDKVVVQVTKDAIGDKGPTLTTYLSIPGRYLVLTPSMTHCGVSRKIDDVKERRRLRRILDSLEVSEGMGVIARTAAMGQTKVELKRDLDYLLGAWRSLTKRLDVGHGPMTLYQESDVAIRTVRDLFGDETKSVIVDDEGAYKKIVEFAELLMPDHVDRFKLYTDARPLFHHYGVEQDFERIFSRRIELPSGGSIVFDQAEALVAIDVNSGKTRTSSFDFEEIALKTNMEAVPEIARQIRLRDLGGILVVDFIDMMKMANRRAVERAFRAELATDRARSKVGRISQFGLLEMTRQRLGPGMGKKLFTNCPSCRGLGRLRTPSSRAAAILRRLGSALTLKGFSSIEVRAQQDVLDYLKREHPADLKALEEKHSRKLRLIPVPDQVEDSVLRYLRTDGREVRPGGRRKR